MKKEIKKRWVDALRSGEFRQGRRYLKRDGKYCCLGVLCEIQNSAEDKDSQFPSGIFLNSVGIRVSFAKTLAEMNDRGMSFGDIATKIENTKF
jgi:hypothetical protein